MREREHVLVVLSSDGWVEVYARRNVCVRMVNRVHATGVDASALDRLVELEVPKCYRKLYWPVRLRCAGQVRKVTPEDRLETLGKVDFLRVLQASNECA